MGKKYESLRESLSMDEMVGKLRKEFQKIPDHRAGNASYQLDDVLMSGFAMFSLKHPSLLDFEQQSVCERKNLQSVFGVRQLCTDAQMRNILDRVDGQPLRSLFPKQFKVLGKLGIVEEYRYWQDHILLTVDGVEHFRSGEVHCEQCLHKQHRDGSVSYSHSMLCAVMVHPEKSEVFVAGAEPITRQDGQQKNDCELNAARRLLGWMKHNYPNERIIVVEDALYSNGPHIRQILENGWEFILSVKPDSHPLLFKLFESRRSKGAVKEKRFERQGLQHHFWFANDMPLNDTAADLRVNFLLYEQKDKKGKISRFSWITSIPLSVANVEKVMRAARSRWKIENETFNTLKNQGYHFEHNYGHGHQNLATVLAYLMLLAFLVDQIFQFCSPVFAQIWKATITKAKLWRGLQSIFHVSYVNSFNELFAVLASLYLIQRE